MLDERDYFYARAEAELEMAQRAAGPEAVRAHYLLAGYYLDRVYSQRSPSDSHPMPALTASAPDEWRRARAFLPRVNGAR